MSDRKTRCICENCEFRNVVFDFLDDKKIQELCDNKEERSFSKGEIIHKEGDNITEFKYLKSGLVKLYRSTPSAGDQIIKQTLALRQRNLIGRVVFVLLYFVNDIYKTRIFDLPVSRKEIAEYIGMSTANVIRTLSNFNRDGIIKVSGKTIEITDINKLEILSKRG